jgi:hypothetical protein
MFAMGADIGKGRLQLSALARFPMVKQLWERHTISAGRDILKSLVDA